MSATSATSATSASDPSQQPIASLPTAQPTARVQRLRALCVTLLLALVVLGAGWELWWAPLRPGGSTLVIKVLPLCVGIAGLLRHRLYTYRWLSLLVWAYVAEGAVRLWSDTSLAGRALAWGELLLAVALFAALTVYIRTRLKNGQAAAEA
jgi:uncharacterized membrane protein